MVLIKSLAILALAAVLVGCELTAKTASPDPVTVGEELTFTIGVDFEPGEPGAIVIDDLPESVRFVSAQVDPFGDCFPISDNVVACAVPNPDPQNGGTATITIIVIPTQCGTFTNTAFIPDIPPILLAEQAAAVEQMSTEQLLQQLPMEELITSQQIIDEESVDFTVVGCEQEQQEQQQQEQQQQQQPAAGGPIVQEIEQEAESGDIDLSFDVS